MYDKLTKPPTKARQQAQADQERRGAIFDGMKALVAKHPGLTHANAFNMLRQSHPHLFSDETGHALTPEVEKIKYTNAQKQAEIKNQIAKMRSSDPHLSFQSAWARLSKEQPGLFSFGAASTAAQSPLEKASNVHQALLRASERRVVMAQREPDFIMLRAEDVDALERGDYD